MKKLFALITIALLITACGAKDQDAPAAKATLTVATSPDYAPYEFINPDKKGQEQYVGADIELAKYIAEQLDMELEIKAVDFSDISSAVGLKKYDMGISGFTFEAERAEIIDFSKPYDTSESACQGLLINKDNANKYTKLEDFNTAKIGAQNGSAQLGYVNEQLTEADVKLVKLLDDGILQLLNNKIDALAISCEAGQGFMLNNKTLELSDVKFALNEDDGTMVILPKDQEELMAKVNAIIDEVVEKGLYVEWMQSATELAKELGEIGI